MIHWLLAGESGSGKSRSMREAVIPAWMNPGRYRLRRPPRPVLVLDPQLKSGWGATWMTGNPDEWLAALRRSRSCVGVWDEAGNEMEADLKLAARMSWAAMQSRNNGHLIYFITQRAYQLPCGIRNQCGSALVFHQRGDVDRSLLARLYGPEMLATNTLDIGECLIARPMEKTVKTRFFRVR